MLNLEEEVKAFIRYWTFPYLRPRRFHAFGVGSPKSGTHSLADLFKRYRTWHEPERERFMRIIRDRGDGRISDSEARDKIRKIDRRKWLEINSSYLNYFFLDLLLEEFPQAKYVLTIRDCYSWLDSMFNQLLGRPHEDYQVQFHQWYADSMSPGRYAKGDQVLAERDLWPLDLWLRIWKEHNQRVLDLVPGEKLLIIRTPEIRRDIPKLESFLGIPPDTLDASRAHSFKAAKKFGLLSEIDRDYLESCVETHCRDLMQRFFPEIRSLSDIPGYGNVNEKGTETEATSALKAGNGARREQA